MTDKEKIRAENDRRLKLAKKNCIESGWDGWVRDDVLSFIDSLPEETDNEEPSCPKESDDLDKLMKEVQKYYSDNFDYITSDQPTLSILTNIARYFTEWQKRKMKERAVGVEVVGEKRDLRLIDSTQRCLFDARRGDWLRVIILPNE